MLDLHSTVVLLKLTRDVELKFIPSTFTFYCSSIKTVVADRVEFLESKFTFYCSSIKTIVWLVIN